MMNTRNWKYGTCVFWMALILPSTLYGQNADRQSRFPASAATEFTIASNGAVSGRVRYNPRINPASCSAYIPANAKTTENFTLCRSDHNGKSEVYACQNYVTNNDHYRAFFKGGRHPKAIARVTPSGKVIKMLWQDEKKSIQPVCDFPPPVQVPAETKFIGAAVCIDEADQKVPCSVFRHSGARMQTVYDYLVYYKPDGTGPVSTELIQIGENKSAMAAELSYQIGLELIKTSCCQQSGLEYLRNAFHLFPDSIAYRTSYLHYKQQMPVEIKRDQVIAEQGESQ